MCRLLAALGKPRSLHELLLGDSHSLEVQSYEPKLMDEAKLNADGFGAAWYVDGQDEPARYRSVLPIWSDENLRTMGAQIRSSHVLAYVRSATPGIGAGMANTQPFAAGPLSFMHNGYLHRFREGTMRRVQQSLGDRAFSAIRGSSDSEHLFALTLDALERGASHGDALRATVDRAEGLSEGERGLLVLMLSDGKSLSVLRAAIHGGKAPTLFLREDDDHVTIASEPLDEGEWEPVPDRGLVTVRSGVLSRSWA